MRRWAGVAAGVAALLGVAGLAAVVTGSSERGAERPAAPATAGEDSGVMPTAANTGTTSEPTSTMTGEQVVKKGGCRNARVRGQVRIELQEADGEEWVIDNCVLEDGLAYAVYADIAPADLPTVTITRTDVLGSMSFIAAARLTLDDVELDRGAFWAPCPDCAGTAFTKVVEMPVVVRNSLFRHPVGTPPQHTEALHVAGAGQGYRFSNTRFVQEGPVNGTQTGALFFHGGRSTFERCWFDDGDQGVSNAFHYTVYVYGGGPGASENVVRDSTIERGITSYVYPVETEGSVVASYVGNRDFHTGEPLVLP